MASTHMMIGVMICVEMRYWEEYVKAPPRTGPAYPNPDRGVLVMNAGYCMLNYSAPLTAAWRLFTSSF
jgi:hypothetical protein